MRNISKTINYSFWKFLFINFLSRIYIFKSRAVEDVTKIQILCIDHIEENLVFYSF